jgi:4-hydroxybenzoate polyprenyltransferase
LVFVRKIAKNTLDFIGYSNLVLAFAVFGSTFQGGFIFKHAADPSIAFSILNFTAAFFLYNLQRIYQSSYPTTDARLLWYRKNKKWIFTLAILFGVALTESLWNIFLDYKEGIFVYCLCALLSIFYFLPPLNLRKLPGIKQFYIALIWVLVCIVIPFLFEESHFMGFHFFGKDQWLYIISQFCFIAALCIPFDIRDINKDREEGTRSIPVVLGLKQSKLFAIALLAIYFVLSFFIETKSLEFVRGLVFIIASLVVWFSEPKRHRYYFIYLAEGIIILQTILLAYLL